MNTRINSFSIHVTTRPIYSKQFAKFDDQRPHKLKTDKSDPSKLYMCTLNGKNYVIQIDLANVPRNKTRAIAKQEIEKLRNLSGKDLHFEARKSTYVYDCSSKLSIEIPRTK